MNIKIFFYSSLFIVIRISSMKLPMEEIIREAPTITLEKSVTFKEVFFDADLYRFLTKSYLFIDKESSFTKEIGVRLLCNRYNEDTKKFDLDLAVFDYLRLFNANPDTTFLEGLLETVSKGPVRKITHNRLIVNFLEYAILNRCCKEILATILAYYPELSSQVESFDKFVLRKIETNIDAIGLAKKYNNSVVEFLQTHLKG